MELFECEKYKARITERCCLLRYRKAIEVNDPKHRFHRKAYSRGDFDWCMECKKGKELMAMEEKGEGLGQGQEVTEQEEELRCDRCNRTPDEVNGFSRKKGRCSPCANFIRNCQREGREVPPYGIGKGKKKDIPSPQPSPTKGEGEDHRPEKPTSPSINKEVREKDSNLVRLIEQRFEIEIEEIKKVVGWRWVLVKGKGWIKVLALQAGGELVFSDTPFHSQSEKSAVPAIEGEAGETQPAGSGISSIEGAAPQTDLVNNPPHYNQGKIGVYAFTEDQGLNHAGACIVKYICRYPHKGAALEDLKKARWYLDRLIEKEEAREAVKHV